MRKTIALLIAVLLVLAFAQLAESQETIEKQAGITPGSIFYNFDIFFDEFKILFSVPEKKADVIIEVANERLAEEAVLIEKNKEQLSEQAEKQRIRQLKKLETLNNPKTDLKEKIEKHIDRLEEVKEQVPEESKDSIENAITASSKVIEKIEATSIKSAQKTSWKSGDLNADSLIDDRDTKYLLNYLQGNVEEPNPILRGDVNGNCVVNIADVVYLNSYLKSNGSAPVKGVCR